MMEKSFIKQTLSDNLNLIFDNMHRACAMSGRSADDVRLLAVTKTVDADRINAAIDLGIRQIGENRVQEFLGKRDALNLVDVQTHLIGHLQTNKVRQIVGNVQMIQSVDSVRVAQAIDRCSKELGIVTPVLVEVNIGGEEAKSGISPDGLEDLLCRMSAFDGIHVCGLMTVPPILHLESEKRKIFSKMYQLFVDMRDKNIDNIDMKELSMGMSDDYVEAILEGSTMIRVGSALFGQRQY